MSDHLGMEATIWLGPYPQGKERVSCACALRLSVIVGQNPRYHGSVSHFVTATTPPARQTRCPAMIVGRYPRYGRVPAHDPGRVPG